MNQNVKPNQEQPKRKMMLNTLTSKLQPKPISMLSSASTKYTINSSMKKDKWLFFLNIIAIIVYTIIFDIYFKE